MRYFVFLILIHFCTAIFAEWVPPDNPSPRQILDEAKENARDGKYEEALLKHIWFHNNALKYDRAFYGVRLSFALSDWKNLSSKYPPALEALEQAQDKAEKNVRNGTNYYDSFNDYEAINEKLGEEDKTLNLFRWLDKNQPDRAKKIYRLVQPTLVRAKEYKLCGKYIDPENAYLRYVRNFRSMLDFSKKNKLPEKTTYFAYASFASDVSTLVALLTISKRHSEAEEVAEMAMLEWDDKKFAVLLDESLKGNVPKQWP